MRSKFFTKALSLLLVVLTLGYIMSVGAFAADAKSSSQSTTHSLVLTSEATTVAIGRKVQMTAKVTNVDKQPTITWSTSDEDIASVDTNGVVKGKNVGKAVIKASAKVDGKTITGEFEINVIKNKALLQNFLEKHQVLSYQYSYVDDYYYTNDKEAWQKHFGFGKIYDLASPYLLLEYDYIRIFFTYENKDWMIQFWKGQYGMIFYGGEVGVYNRKHSEDGVNDWTMYGCAKEEDWLAMDMTLYHQNLNGEFVREFTREYDKYWWCTGFKNGHLREEEPADELRLAGRITFKSEEMAQIVYDGLLECGFKAGKKADHSAIDTVYKKGKDLHYSWQNISEAESTMAVKVVGGAAITAILLPLFAPIMIPYAGGFLLMCALVSIII
ncbi:MAG: DUF4474 domain-containing protein [Clostridia bacterium]|nr:DUF4474 domain-containing protein [Clostridia bacterium]MBR4050549.1 DUF4474 domain-containing protein [Clostridia bacterium]